MDTVITNLATLQVARFFHSVTCSVSKASAAEIRAAEENRSPEKRRDPQLLALVSSDGGDHQRKHLDRVRDRGVRNIQLPDQDSNLDEQNQNLLC